ncbi:MAG TPA: ionic transporter y4hA [Beijerinckiaceae bacterium]|jgi:Ca2+:H+ antiporter|nr:ionic transporter y4hA [Beijerinckiaceae bacterium]
MMSQDRMAIWAWLSPVIAWVILGLTVIMGTPPVVVAVAVIALFATVFAAVHHAEVVAHRVGEPFGTLVLAVAVTIIEVALIISVMAGGADKAGLARDTVFAAVMIVCNGIVGLCLLVGGLRHREQGFQLQGASAALVVLAALTTLTMILPNVTTTVQGPVFSTPQLIFVAIISLILYGAFIFIQTIRHRDYFLSAKADGEDAHVQLPSNRTTLISAGLLCAALVAVVGLAKALTPSVDGAIARLGMPASLSGIIIATLVLLPEGLAALRAAQANRLQTSLNLALGSSLATIGLTIPAVAAVSILSHTPLELGLGAKESVLLALTLFLGAITLGTGRTTMLQGVVHLVVFAAFLFFAISP